MRWIFVVVSGVTLAACSSSNSHLTNCSPPPVASESAQASVASGNDGLSVTLLQTLSPANPNLFFSPWSLTAALSMTYAGANGDTAAQMEQVLQFGAAASDYAPAFGALDCTLEADGQANGATFDVANAVFGQVDGGFLSGYLSTLSSNYGAPLQTVDFVNDPETARGTINAWVSHETKGLIPTLLPDGTVTSDTRLVLADAIYFHDSWAEAFDTSQTSQQPFQVSSTDTIQVPMMQGSQSSARYFAGSTYAIAELPYQDKLALDIVLPTDVDGLSAVVSSLSAASLTAALGQLATTTLAVQLPKLSLNSQLSLVPTFQALGLTLPFAGGQADFSGIDGAQDLFISFIQHQAVLVVDEAGTTAAAATSVGVSTLAVASGPQPIIVNHPFLLLLRDVPSGTIIFAGQVTNPLSN